MPAAVHNKDV